MIIVYNFLKLIGMYGAFFLALITDSINLF